MRGRPIGTNAAGCRLTVAVLATVAVLGSPIVAKDLLSAQEAPQRGIFTISVWERVQQGQYGSWRGVDGGSAFFISPDGRALTASHVVHRASKDPSYRLLAIVEREFYSASLTCASELPSADQHTNVTLSRDVAEIRLTPADFPFDQISPGNVPFATAHRGSLPTFPALQFGPEPRAGDRVRVLGFGATQQPLPYAWSAEGEVSRITTFTDGTPAFKVVFTAKPATFGHSGSPVLNSTGQVVGMWIAHDSQDVQVGTAISSLALQPACP